MGKGQIKRKRLFDKLSQNENCKIIMVTAPAGYGKTSLIAAWAAYRLKKCKVTWLMLEEEDNDEELFWSYFLLSFYKNRWVPEEMKKRAEAMLDKGTFFSRLWLVHFINDITEIGTQVTMVLDDLEVIKDEKIINNLEFLIRHLPSNVHIILSGREALGIGLSKNKASGEAFELTGKELSFTEEETISFFRNRVQINLSQEEYSKINRAFEGWAAGIVLLAMTIKKNGSINGSA